MFGVTKLSDWLVGGVVRRGTRGSIESRARARLPLEEAAVPRAIVFRYGYARISRIVDSLLSKAAFYDSCSSMSSRVVISHGSSKHSRFEILNATHNVGKL